MPIWSLFVSPTASNNLLCGNNVRGPERFVDGSGRGGGAAVRDRRNAMHLRGDRCTCTDSGEEEMINQSVGDANGGFPNAISRERQPIIVRRVSCRKGYAE